MTDLGEALKQARLLRKMSLRDVQDVTGISNAYISQLENGRTKNPAAFILYQLARIYEVSIDSLFKIHCEIDVKEEMRKVGLSLLLDLTVEEGQELLKYAEYLVFKREA